MPIHFKPPAGSSTIPGAASEKTYQSLITGKDGLNQHYNTTMRQMQAGMGDNGDSFNNNVQVTISGALQPTSLPSSTPSIAGLEGKIDNPLLLRPDTLAGATSPLIGATAQQAAWLQKAEILSKQKTGETTDTISAAGPDAERHLNSLSIPGNPYFIRGTLQDTIQAVGVTISGGATSLSDTIPGTFFPQGRPETAPIGAYSPLPLKSTPDGLLPSHDRLAPAIDGKNPLHPEDSGKNTSIDPHVSSDSKDHPVDLLHQVDHQITIDLGKYSGVSTVADPSKLNTFRQDDLTKTLAHTDEPFAGKSDDSLITLLDEEQKKRMANTLNISGPFGGHS